VTVSRDGRWHAAPYSYADALGLARELGVSETLATVLVRRGLSDPAAARSFLAAADAHDPFAFEGIGTAVDVLLSHVERSSPIAVHGDYDVDGVCSTALLVAALRELGADVRPRLPSRMEDGYGLSRRAVEELSARGAGLLVTVDCGIGAVEEVAFARSLGMDVIVTDHHRPGPELPACPVVHPVVCGYPCEELCATGVAFKLAEALYARAGRDPGTLERELDIVALATVADLVPLRGENRSLVRRGLRALQGARRPGLRALLRVAGVDPQSVTEQTLGFGLAPRINAAGRLYRADAGLDLMLTTDEDRALEIARELDAVNSERQAVETGILLEAEAQLTSDPERLADPVHVLAGDGWHPGVVGIVASRLVERYHRPFVLVGLDGDGRGRGSARSISAYDLHAGMASASEHLERFGGHRMAAGLELEEARLEPFRQALLEHARAALRPEDLARTEYVDAIVPGDAVCLDLAEQLQALRPFGMGNPAVRLLLPGARLGEVRPMGEGRHARLTIASAGVRARAVAFGVGESFGEVAGDGPAAAAARHDFTARLEINEWGGAVEPRLVVNAVHSLPEPECEDAESCADCACRARSERWWDSVLAEPVAPVEPTAPPTPVETLRTVIDRRGEGVLGTLSELLSTGEPLLVACADVSRRRALFARELSPQRFGRPAVTCLSARCAPGAAAEPGGFGASVWLAEHAALERDPGLPARFRHVFVLDPPPFAHVERLLAAGASGADHGFLHLGWGEAELEFSRKVLAHELSLRASLSALYRGLTEAGGMLEGAALESLLMGAGPHPRTPVHAARCLRVLTDLGLVAVERSSATVRCTITSEERVELESSSAYRAYSLLCEEGLRFLNEQTSQKAPQPRTKHSTAHRPARPPATAEPVPREPVPQAA
jgi:single-stranded-DNA-specific exonuclease